MAEDRARIGPTWIGKGRVRSARGNGAGLAIDGVTSRGGSIQKPVREYFRAEARGVNKSDPDALAG